MKIGFDIISDLNLDPEESFNWQNKATSLYCIVAGNLSSDLRTIKNTLTHLARYYQGVFYIMGTLEYKGVEDVNARTEEILRACTKMHNVVALHHHVVIIDGIAILGCNGWGSDAENSEDTEKYYKEDIQYLTSSVEKLQKHLDVTKIIMVSNAVPGNKLYFGEVPESVENQVPLNIITFADTQRKISHWVFGTSNKIVDNTIHDINYVTNPYLKKKPYWARRIEVEV